MHTKVCRDLRLPAGRLTLSVPPVVGVGTLRLPPYGPPAPQVSPEYQLNSEEDSSVLCSVAEWDYLETKGFEADLSLNVSPPRSLDVIS